MAKQTQQPNLIFVFPDQLGAISLGCYDNPNVRTPNIDRFAEQGVLFEQAYTASPVSTPFRGTLFTGRYPSQTGIVDNGMSIPLEETTLPQVLNEAGYHTAYVGKWHLSGQPGGNQWVPTGNQWVPPEKRAGFQTFVGWESHHIDHTQGRIWRDTESTPPQPEEVPMPGHETDALTDIALDVLKTLPQPFCLFVAYQAPHPPCAPPPEFLAQYEGRVLFFRPNTEPKAWYSKPEWDCDYNLRTFMNRYYGEVSHFDAAFGRLLDGISKQDLDDHTTVVLTSDHGEMMGSHGLFGKGVMYEEATRIPLMVRHPAGVQGERVYDFFSSVDFFRTVLGLCDVPVPDSAEGVNYAPLIRGQKQQNPREAVFIEYGDNLCLRQDECKLIAKRPTEPDAPCRPTALYDLEDDVFEKVNLLNKPGQEGLVQDLQDLLQAWYEAMQGRA